METWSTARETPPTASAISANNTVPGAAPREIWQVASHPKQWVRQVQGTESIYCRSIGSAEALMAKAEKPGQVTSVW